MFSENRLKTINHIFLVVVFTVHTLQETDLYCNDYVEIRFLTYCCMLINN